MGLIPIRSSEEVVPSNLMHNFYYLQDYLSAIAEDPLLAEKITSSQTFIDTIEAYLANNIINYVPDIASQLISMDEFYEGLVEELLKSTLFMENIVKELSINEEFLRNLPDFMKDNLDLMDGLAYFLARDTGGVNIEDDFFIIGTTFEVESIQVDSRIERTKKSVHDHLTEDCDGSEWHIIFTGTNAFKVYRIDIPILSGEEWPASPTQSFLDNHYAGEGQINQAFISSEYLDTASCAYKSYGTNYIDMTTGEIFSTLNAQQPNWEEINILRFTITQAYTPGAHFILRTFNRDLFKYGFIANMGIFLTSYGYFKDEFIKYFLKKLDSAVGIFPMAEKVSSIIDTGMIGHDQKESVVDAGSSVNQIKDTALSTYGEHYFDNMVVLVDSEISKITSFIMTAGIPRLNLETALSTDPSGKDYKILYWFRDRDVVTDPSINKRIDNNILEGEIQLYSGSDRDDELLHPFVVSLIEVIPFKSTDVVSTTITALDIDPCRLTLGNLSTSDFATLPLGIGINTGAGQPIAYIIEKIESTKVVYLATSPIAESADNAWTELGWSTPVAGSTVIYFRKTLDNEAEFDFEIYGDINFTELTYQKVNNLGAFSDIRHFWYYGTNYGKMYIRLTHKQSATNTYLIRVTGVYLADLDNIEAGVLNSIAQIKGVNAANWAEDVPYERSLKGLDARIGSTSLPLLSQIENLGEDRLSQYDTTLSYDGEGNINGILVMNTAYIPSRKIYDYVLHYNAQGNIDWITMEVYDENVVLQRTLKDSFTYDVDQNITDIVRTIV